MGNPVARHRFNTTMRMRFILAGLALAACRPHAVPTGPGTEPAQPPPAPPARRAETPGREVLVGEMCPQAADGRPAVMPVLARRLAWTGDEQEVVAPIERQGARQFTVFRWDGSRAGLFSVAGATDLGLDRAAAVGAYAGASPCTTAAAPDEIDAACNAAQSQCGVAVAVLGTGSGFGAAGYGEDPDPVDLPTGGACAADGLLVIDIDGDGEPEAFPASAFVDPARKPSEEVAAVPRRGARCQARFAIRHLLAPAEPHWGGLDLLGVVDLDGDGRRELLLAYHYPTRRTWAIYSASGSAGRLELAGEATPWPRP